jgi:hypothetical protein
LMTSPGLLTRESTDSFMISSLFLSNPISTTLFRPLFCLDNGEHFNHLGFQKLIENRFHQLLESGSSLTQKIWQEVRTQGKVKFGHRVLIVENRLFAQRLFSGRSMAFSIISERNLQH